MLVVVLGGVEVGAQAVALHLPEQVHPLTTSPRAVVEALREMFEFKDRLFTISSKQTA